MIPLRSFMNTVAWAKRLMLAAYTRGLLTSVAQQKSLFLVEQGLHPEQVLIGTGLMTPSDYASCVEECFAVALTRLDIEAFTLDQVIDEDTFLARDEQGSVLLCAVDAWTREICVPEQAALFPIFRSDSERFFRRKEVLDLCVARWFEMLEAQAATECRLGVLHEQGVVLLGSEEAPYAEGALEKEEVPAMQAWFEYGFGSRFWMTSRRPGLESDWIEASSKHTVHPLAKSALWKGFLEVPRGVLIAVHPDQWLLHRLEALPKASSSEEFFTDDAHQVCPASPEEDELAWHAALQGKPLCWIDHEGGMLTRARLLASAGVPVTVVRRRAHSQGGAWEMYHVHI